MHPIRLEKLRTELRDRGINCAVIMPGPNLCYLTGLRMKASERISLLFLRVLGEPRLLLPRLETPQAEKSVNIPVQIYSYRDEEGPDSALARIARDLQLDGKTLGVEFREMRVLELSRLEQHTSRCALADLGEAMAGLRMTKDDREIEALRSALRLTECALEQTLSAIRPGMSEREIACLYQIEALQVGGEELSFPTIVASGPNGGSPHAAPSERAVGPGDLITIDCGAMREGYPGDLTRNLALGEIDPELEKIHEIVAEANAAGREACRPGAAAQDVDRAARRVIKRAGYGDSFIHRTGHGLGLEVHEPPYIMEGNEQELKPGMVFTIEPGIYLPGRGGVRIEDVMLITPDGAETLTHFPRELVRL